MRFSIQLYKKVKEFNSYAWCACLLKFYTYSLISIRRIVFVYYICENSFKKLYSRNLLSQRFGIFNALLFIVVCNTHNEVCMSERMWPRTSPTDYDTKITGRSRKTNRRWWRGWFDHRIMDLHHVSDIRV